MGVSRERIAAIEGKRTAARALNWASRANAVIFISMKDLSLLINLDGIPAMLKEAVFCEAHEHPSEFETMLAPIRTKLEATINEPLPD